MVAWVVIYRLHHRQAVRPHTTHAVAEGHRRTFHSLTPFLYLFTYLLPYFLFARHVTKNLSPQLLWNPLLPKMPGVPRSFFPLFALCTKSISHLFSNHAFPHSFKKTPGWRESFSPSLDLPTLGTFTHSGELLQSGVALRQ